MASSRGTRPPLTSISTAGADNPEAPSLIKKGQENPVGEQPTLRGARVLGDIGNRLKKHIVTGQGGQQPLGKLPMKATVKPSVGLSKQPAFVVPRAAGTTRGPISGGGGVSRGGENAKPPQQLTRSLSMNIGPHANKKPSVAATGGGTTKVLGSLQNRSQSQISLKDGILKSLSTVIDKPSSTAAITVYHEKEKSKPKTSIKEILAEDNSSKAISTDVVKPKISTEAPTNEVFDELKDKTDTIKKDNNNEVDVFSSKRFEILDIDAGDGNNPLLLKEYIQDICDYLFALEKKYPIKIRYLEGRLVNSKMRAVLLDWLVEVHHQFGFMPETLYMASKTLDRYLQKERKVTRKQLQLVGVTAMYLAAKFEEVCTPTVVDFSAVSDNAFSASEVRVMEKEILQSLDFDLAPPPAVFFLRRFSKAAGVSDGRAPILVHTMAKYIMDLTLVDYSTCHFLPSEQAAASLALALLVMNKTKPLKELWTPTLQHHTRVTTDALKPILTPVACILAKTHEEVPKLKAVYNKFARNRLSKISLVPELNIEEWKDRVTRDLC